MSIQSEIERISENIASTYGVLASEGATMPTARNSDNLPDTAASITAVLYGKAQTLTDAQKAQARANIDALAKNQGAANVGKILVVGADGNLMLTDMPEGGASGDVIGTLDENNNIVITGDLAKGTYVFKYEGTDGTYTDIGNLVVGGVVEYSITATLTNCTGVSENATAIEEDGAVTLVFTANDGYVLPESVMVGGATYTWDASAGTLVLSEPTEDVVITIVATVYTAYTNVLPLAQEYASTSPYVGTDGSVGYGNNMRVSTSSASATYMKSGSGVDTTAMIPVKRGDVLRFKNCNIKVTPSNISYGTFIQGFNGSKAVEANFNASYNNIQSRLPCVVEGGEIVQITLEPLAAWTTSNIDSVAYIMIGTDGLDETSIITINEEITD